MKIKKIIGSLAAGVAMLAVAGTALADNPTYEINIYGASAQFTFWNAAVPNWIKSLTSSTYGCSSSTTVTTSTFNSTNKVHTAACTNANIIVRVSSKASFDGILALKGDDSQAASGSTAEKCESGQAGYPTNASDAPYYRKMADETSLSGGTIASLKCYRVTIGASDVAGASFKQSSNGSLNGTSAGAYTVRSFSGIDTTGLTAQKPFLVPFAFYVNTSNSTLNTAMNDNISRMQAVLLFSGQIADWSQFGSSYPSLHTTVCLRHAGSGTHSTLDYAVLRGGSVTGTGTNWGHTPATTQNTSFNATTSSLLPTYDSTSPDIYFNDATGDELNCINNHEGAIGYADADKAWNSTTTSVNYNPIPGYANIKQLKYQGEYATADSIQHGRYDFWTNEFAYYDTTQLSTTMRNLVYSTGTPKGILKYVAGNIPASETYFWVYNNVATMPFTKSTDKKYPQYGN